MWQAFEIFLRSQVGYPREAAPGPGPGRAWTWFALPSSRVWQPFLAHLGASAAFEVYCPGGALALPSALTGYSVG